MGRAIKNPWVDLPTTDPFVLAGDAEALSSSPWTARKPELEFRFDALPEPFLGDPVVFDEPEIA